jgi:hypothetical protein
MNEKENLERAACDYFIRSYNNDHGTRFEIVCHQDRPDFLTRDSNSGETLGIEITHLFYDDKVAKMVLGRLSGQLHGAMTLPNLIDKLNAKLAEKVNRAARYPHDGKLVLVIRVASPIFDKRDFEMYSDEIAVPTLNTFAEIWLLFRNLCAGTFSDLLQIQ